MLLTPTIILGLLAVVSACPDYEARADDHSTYSTRAAPFPPLTLPTRPLQWGDINIIHTTDSHGWLLGHQKTSFPEPNYRCIEALGWIWNNRRVDIIQWWFRWFRVVRSTYENNCFCTCFSLLPCELASKSLFRSATSTFCSSILEICTMVRVNGLQKIHPRNILTGTGLTDGFPPGGVDAHDVCLNLLNFWNIYIYICSFRPINLLRNYHMI